MKSLAAGALAGLCSLFACVTTAAAAPSHSHGKTGGTALVLKAGATPDVLQFKGGFVHIKATVSHAQECQLKAAPGGPLTVFYSHNRRSCSTGHFDARALISANTSPRDQVVKFTLTASNATSSHKGIFYVVVKHRVLKPHHTTTTTTTGSTTTTTSGSTTSSSSTTTTTAGGGGGGGGGGGTTTTTASTTTTTTSSVAVPNFTCTLTATATSGNNTFEQNCDGYSATAGGSRNVFSTSSFNQETVSITPKAANDVFVVGVSAAPNVAASSLSGGGVTWHQVTTQSVNITGTANNVSNTLFWGQESGGSAFTLTVTLNGSATASEVTMEEFGESGGAATWTQVAGGNDTPTGTHPPYPSLNAGTPTNQEIYVGYGVLVGITSGGMHTENVASAGSTAGYSYATTQFDEEVAWHLNVSSTQQPNFTQSLTGQTDVATGVVLAD